MREIILERGEELLVTGQSSVSMLVVNVDGEIYTRTDCRRLENRKGVGK